MITDDELLEHLAAGATDQRARDRLTLAVLVGYLRSGRYKHWRRENAEESAAALLRFLEDDYPPQPAHAPTVASRNLWIALAYEIRTKRLKEKGAAVEAELAHIVTNYGVPLKPTRVRTIAAEHRDTAAFKAKYAELLALPHAATGKPSPEHALSIVSGKLMEATGFLTQLVLNSGDVRKDPTSRTRKK